MRDPILFVSYSSWIGPPCREGPEPVLHLRDYRADRDDERDGMLCEYQTDEVPFGGRVPVDLGRDVIFSDGSTLGTATPAIVNDRPLHVIAGSTRGFARLLLLDDGGHTWCFPGDGKPAIPISDVPVGRDAVHFGETVALRFVLGGVVARRPDGGETFVPSGWPRSDAWLVDAPVGVRIADQVVVDMLGNYRLTFQNTGACPFLAE